MLLSAKKAKGFSKLVKNISSHICSQGPYTTGNLNFPYAKWNFKVSVKEILANLDIFNCIVSISLFNLFFIQCRLLKFDQNQNILLLPQITDALELQFKRNFHT